MATARDPTKLSFNNTDTTNYLPFKLDVTLPSDIESAFPAALQKFGRIDIVINNAANGIVAPLETLTLDQIRAQFDTNFFSVVQITQRALKQMRTQSPPGGLIMQVSTTATQDTYPMLGTHCASKMAVETLSKSVRTELKPEWNINLVSVQLDGVDTQAHDKSMVYGEVEVPEYDHMNGRAWVESIKTSLPLITQKTAAKAMYDLTKIDVLPATAVLGGFAIKMAKEKHKGTEGSGVYTVELPLKDPN